MQMKISLSITFILSLFFSGCSFLSISVDEIQGTGFKPFTGDGYVTDGTINVSSSEISVPSLALPSETGEFATETELNSWNYLLSDNFKAYSYSNTVMVEGNTFNFGSVESDTKYIFNPDVEYTISGSLSYVQDVQFCSSSGEQVIWLGGLSIEGVENVVIRDMDVRSQQSCFKLYGMTSGLSGSAILDRAQNPKMIENIVFYNCKLQANKDYDPTRVFSDVYAVKGMRLFHNEFYGSNDDILYGGWIAGLEIADNYFHSWGMEEDWTGHSDFSANNDSQNDGWEHFYTGRGDAIQLRGGSQEIYIHHNIFDKKDGVWKFDIILEQEDWGKSIIENNIFYGPRTGRGGAAIFLNTYGNDNMAVIQNNTFCIDSDTTGIWNNVTSNEGYIYNNIFTSYDQYDGDPASIHNPGNFTLGNNQTVPYSYFSE